jgi:hypothetical protein
MKRSRWLDLQQRGVLYCWDDETVYGMIERAKHQLASDMSVLQGFGRTGVPAQVEEC